MTETKIMVVEDEGVVAMHLSKTLSGWGYLVTSVSATAEAAIRNADTEPPDLILMDINLKGETDGIQAAEAIYSRHDVPVVFLTAYRDEETLERAKSTAPYGYALKPFDENELKITIEMALFRHRADLAIREREQWLDATLSSAADAMIATDTDGLVRFMNEQAETLTGWSCSEAYARDIADVLRSPPSEDFITTEHFVQRALRKHTMVSRGPGSLLLTRSGDELPIEDCAAPIRDPDGQVRGVVVTFRDASERRRAEAHLVRMAHHDPLTGLANRVLFQERLHRTIAQAKRSGGLVAVLLLDLDEFKTVNDTLGHAAGDALLVAAADRIRANVRETDTVARLGGDEIAVIQPNLDSLECAPALADKFVGIFNRPFVIDGTEITTTASVGMTIFPNDAEDPESILEQADKAMYRAKAAGRNRFNMSSHNGPSTARRHEFSERELRLALERSEFEIHFQPIFSLQPRRLTGAEALVRWNHPEKGLIPASRFIRDAERIGIIDTIIEMTLRQSCAALRGWLGGAPDMKISINVSPSELKRRDLVNAVSRVLNEESLPPGHLELEVDERSAIEERQSQTAINIRGLRNLGLMISLDQFGHEYASMMSMTTSSVGAVKIDRSVVKGIPNDSRAIEIVKATVDISEKFDITVVAVGVETEEQMRSLREAGCHQAQGELLGSAMATNEFFNRYLM